MKRKWIMTTGLLLFVMAGTAGCGNRPETAYSPPENLVFNDIAETAPQNDNSVTTNTPPESTSEIPADTVPENDSNAITDSPQTLDISDPNAVFIGGKVRSVSQDSFVLSRTLMEDSFVIMPEAGSPDEVLVTVRCSDSTVFEHWTIEGGGAGITKAEATFSDIREGDGLEAAGSFDGEEFVAEKVIIELYR